MPGTRMAADAVKAAGRKHLTKAEYEGRKAAEAVVPADLRAATAPDYLAEWPELMDEFERYAAMLSAIMPENFGAPDADALARYVVSERCYERSTALVLNAATTDEFRQAQMAQDKAMRQARQCAADLGLTVSSRCRLVIPRLGGSDDDECEF